VTIYTRTVCKLCDQVKIKLTQAGIEFETVNLDLPEHAEAKSYVENVLGARSVPVTVSDGFPPILGYRPEKIKQLVAYLTSNERKE
jgi:glutaredoxin-like protein NrdH